MLNSQLPLFREGQYLLAEEIGIRDTARCHAVLGAIAMKPGGDKVMGTSHLERLRRTVTCAP